MLPICIVGTVFFFEIQKMVNLRLEVAERAARLEEKKRGAEKYREKVNFYKTDEGLLHLARDRYNLGFAGERVYVIDGASSDMSFD